MDSFPLGHYFIKDTVFANSSSPNIRFTSHLLDIASVWIFWQFFNCCQNPLDITFGQFFEVFVNLRVNF